MEVSSNRAAGASDAVQQQRHNDPFLSHGAEPPLQSCSADLGHSWPHTRDQAMLWLDRLRWDVGAESTTGSL